MSVYLELADSVVDDPLRLFQTIGGPAASAKVLVAICVPLTKTSAYVILSIPRESVVENHTLTLYFSSAHSVRV